MTTLAVHTSGLTRRFGAFTAVDHVTMDVRQGEIFGFLGANGAGKTTLIRMLCGLLLPSEGTGQVAGLDVFRQSEQIKRNIGYMSQKFSLYEDLTVSENIRFYGGIYGLRKATVRSRQQELFDRFGLAPFERTLTAQLTPGFKQRLSLGCATLHQPPIIFLDEPTSGVDPRARRSFWDIIYKTAATGTTVFVTTHFMEEAEYCHRVSIMSAGRVIALDTPAALKDRYHQQSMQDVFVKLVRESETNPCR